MRPLLYLLALAAPVALVVAAMPSSQDQATVRFDGDGLKSIQYRGVELLASGRPSVNAVRFATAAGGVTDGELHGQTVADAASQQVVETFRWGTVKTRYHAQGDRVDLTIVVDNRSAMPLDGIAIEPLSIQLPAAPREYDGVTPMMAFDPGEPGVVSLSHPAGTVVLTNEDVDKPLLIGFPWSSNRPANTVFPLRVHTLSDPSYPTLYPPVVRPIAANASEEFHLSLRFGPGGITVRQLAQDLYTRFAGVFAQQLQWQDRRPIGQLVLATASTGWATNPRGWLLDSKIDVNTPAGLAAFRTRILAWADESVRTLRDIDAQGMIVWDIEGEQFPHPITYLCDPRVLRQTAPEMDTIADAFFQKFRDAGFRVGVCVRPQQLVMSGRPTPSQQDAPDPAQVLIEKIAYAKARWGASLFYVDSNGDPNLPMDAGVFQRVLTAHPDILLIPEHENLRYYAYAAPYREMRQGHVSTPAIARWLYPDAFGITYVADGDFTKYGETLGRSLEQGDVALTRGWFADPANAVVKTMPRPKARAARPR